MVEDTHGLAVHLLPGAEECVVIDLLVLVGITRHVGCPSAGRDGTGVARDHMEPISSGLGCHAPGLLLRSSEVERERPADVRLEDAAKLIPRDRTPIDDDARGPIPIRRILRDPAGDIVRSQS
jgi:hypothetical protein